MIPLSATQAARATEGAIAPLVLAVLTTYTDHDAETVDRVFYWSAPTPAVYPWGGGDRQDFLDVIEATETSIPGVSAVGIQLPRTPAPRAFPRQAVALTLRDRDLTGGETLWTALKGRNLHGARLVLAELLVDPLQRLQVGGRLQWDLADESGTDHTVRFRGDLVQVEGRTPDGQITLRFAQESPELPLVELLDPVENDPRDFGSVAPMPIGRAKRVRCRNERVGFVTTLAQSISPTYTGPTRFTDVTGWDASQGAITIRLENEEVKVEAVDQESNTAEIVERGANGTQASPHRSGSPAIEMLAAPVLVRCASTAVRALRALYLRDPYTSEIVRLDESSYRFLPASGVVEIDEEGLRTILGELFRSSQVTVQPQYQVTTSSSPEQTSGNQYVPSDESEDPSDSGWNVGHGTHQAVWSQFVSIGSPSAAGTYIGKFVSGDLSGDGALEVKRWRMALRIVSTSGEFGKHAKLTNSGIPGMGSDSISVTTSASNGDDRSDVSPWRTPPAGTTLNALVGKELRCYGSLQGSGGQGTHGFELRHARIEAEVVTSGGGGGSGDASVVRSRDAEIESGAVGFGLEFFADVDGPVIPFEFEEGAYDWDEGSGWNLADATHSDEGSAQRFGFSPDLVEGFEDHTEWTDGGGVDTSTETTDLVEGSGALRVELTGSSNRFASKTLPADVDLTGGYLVLGIKLIPSGAVSGEIGITLSSSTSSGSNFNRWLFPASEFDGAYRFLVLDMDSLPSPDLSGGSYDPAGTRSIRVNPEVPVGDVVLYDEMRWIPKSARAQKNDVGTPDLSSEEYLYRLTVTGEGLEILAAATVEMADIAGSGTTQPADRREIEVPVSSLEEAQEVTLDIDGANVGEATVGSVQTLAVSMALQALTAENEASILEEAVELPEIELARIDRVPLSFDSGYAFDEGTGWGTDQGSHTDFGFAQGFGVAPELVEGFEDHNEWSPAGGVSLSTEMTDLVEGSGALRVELTGATNRFASKTLPADVDLTGGYLVLGVKLIPDGAVTGNRIGFTLSSSTNPTNNFRRWFFSPEQFEGGYRFIVFDMDDLPSSDLSSGSYDPASTRSIRLNPEMDVGETVLYDEMRWVPKSARAQKNDVGTPDLESSAYRVAVQVSSLAFLASAKLDISDTAGSGTTAPSDRRELTLPTASLVQDQLAIVTAPHADVGSPGVGAVETIGVSMEIHGLTAPGESTVFSSAVALPQVVLAEIQVSSSSSSRFVGSPGDPIEHPVDVLRWVVADLLGLGDAALGDTLDDAAPRLADIRLAGNLLSHGHTLDDVLAGIAYESRAWIFAVERAAGTVYQMLTPQALAYDWPAATVEIANLEGLAEGLPGRAEVGNHLLGFYGYEASRGNNEEAFTRLVRATEAENDTPVADATIAASVAAIGARRVGPLPFYLIQEAETASDTLGFYASLALREKAALWEVPADHWEAFALEPGDLRLVQPAWLGAPAKALVLGATRALGSTTVRLLLAEVD